MAKKATESRTAQRPVGSEKTGRHVRRLACRTFVRRVARASRKSASAAVWASSSARLPAPATRARNHAAAILVAVVLKAARIHCTAACPSAAFTIRFGVTYSVLNLEDFNVFPAGETVTPDILRAHGFIRRKDRQDQDSRRRRSDREARDSRPRLQPSAKDKIAEGRRHVSRS